MKKLLLIIFLSTPLFSTTAFTKINLVCDTSYWFSPDLEERVLISIDKTKNQVSILKLSMDLMEVRESNYSDLIITNEFYKFNEFSSGFYGSRLNRTTLEFTGEYKYKRDLYDGEFKEYMLGDKLIHQCEKVDEIKYLDAKKEFQQYTQKFTDKRKI